MLILYRLYFTLSRFFLKQIDANELKQKIVKALSEIGYRPDPFIKASFKRALDDEDNELTCDVLKHLIENGDIAKEGNFPLCQDTGIVVFWVKIGEMLLKQANLNHIINEAVEEAYRINNYRHSVVKDPVNRVNTQTNTPAVIHYELVDGNELEISMMMKGGGSENMSALRMLTPSDGIVGIRDFVLETVRNAGSNACPPLIVGIGIGGNFETCALLAKKSLFRPFDEKNGDTFWAKEEEYMLNEINKLGIGVLGMGGKNTAFKVHIEVAPCHIASLPVAVNLECHAHRVIKI
jgi:fumarate hydratase subunit alpha